MAAKGNVIKCFNRASEYGAFAHHVFLRTVVNGKAPFAYFFLVGGKQVHEVFGYQVHVHVNGVKKVVALFAEVFFFVNFCFVVGKVGK